MPGQKQTQQQKQQQQQTQSQQAKADAAAKAAADAKANSASTSTAAATGCGNGSGNCSPTANGGSAVLNAAPTTAAVTGVTSASSTGAISINNSTSSSGGDSSGGGGGGPSIGLSLGAVGGFGYQAPPQAYVAPAPVATGPNCRYGYDDVAKDCMKGPIGPKSDADSDVKVVKTEPAPGATVSPTVGEAARSVPGSTPAIDSSGKDVQKPERDWL
jgi:hypothetical protein